MLIDTETLTQMLISSSVPDKKKLKLCEEQITAREKEISKLKEVQQILEKRINND